VTEQEPERWDGAVVALATQRVGRPLWHYTRVPSTMPLAHAMAANGASDGTALIADEQTAGRGRRGRAWHAPAGSAILCSIIFRPPLPPERLFALTALVSLGLAEGVERVTGLIPQVKWPNDLVLGGKKLAGVLTATRLTGAVLDHVVVGFGLNVSLRVADLPPLDRGLPPTSLAIELGAAPERLAVMQAVLESIDTAYTILRRGGEADLLAAWRARLAGLGEWVHVEAESGPVAGRLVGADSDGALLLATPAGQIRVLAGDVVLGPRATERADHA
jgi:BirA family transcriptional regulator, biotin operon repressor / biotin---[acetyl-CoA-carboxylase] ligase